MDVERIKVAGVPVDIVRPENLEKVLFDLLENPGTKQIVFLSVWNLLKARSNAEYKLCLENASLVLPVSKSIVNGAVFLKKQNPCVTIRFRRLFRFLRFWKHVINRCIYSAGAEKCFPNRSGI